MQGWDNVLTRLTITMKNESDIKLNYNISSLLHGALIEKIDPEYSDILHQSTIKPFSQYSEFDGNTIKWTINSLNEEATTRIGKMMLNDEGDSIFLTHKNLSLKILEKGFVKKSYDELLDETYFKDGSRFINLQFVTPTAFKSQGNFVFFPELRHIFQSLISKYDYCSKDSAIGSEELLEHITTNSVMTRYNLRSTYFHLEGIKVPSFMGWITIKINGPQAMVNLANLLFAFGEYSGVGVKNALGMGGIRLLRESSKGGRVRND